MDQKSQFLANLSDLGFAGALLRLEDSHKAAPLQPLFSNLFLVRPPPLQIAQGFCHLLGRGHQFGLLSPLELELLGRGRQGFEAGLQAGLHLLTLGQQVLLPLQQRRYLELEGIEMLESGFGRQILLTGGLHGFPLFELLVKIGDLGFHGRLLHLGLVQAGADGFGLGVLAGRQGLALVLQGLVLLKVLVQSGVVCLQAG